MTFWENLGDTLSAKGREVADKAKNLTEIASLRGQIVTCENTITKNYKDIGKEYYETHKSESGDAFQAKLDAIKNAEKSILELQKRIQELKGTKHCNKCGANVDDDCIYCPKCGCKMDDGFFDEEDEESSDFQDIIQEEDIID